MSQVGALLKSGPSRLNFIAPDRYGILGSMMKLSFALLLVAAAFSGCSTPNVSRSGTLLSGLTQYQGDMQSINSSSRWPERQRSAGTLKTVILGTVGASPEFYRLVDLDLRKREFIATMRDTNVRPDRLREMQDELVAMDEEIAALKPVVKTQLTAVARHELGNPIENAATLGLLGMAVDSFSAGGGPRGAGCPVGSRGSVSGHRLGHVLDRAHAGGTILSLQCVQRTRGGRRDYLSAGAVEWRMENGEWRMENGEWRMENGEWRMENGEWRMENGFSFDA